MSSEFPLISALRRGRDLTAAAQKLRSPDGRLGSRQEKEEKSDASFAELLSTNLRRLNRSQLKAQDLMARFAAGQVDDPAQVLMETEKAELGMRFALRVQSKALEAYEEIMRMQV